MQAYDTVNPRLWRALRVVFAVAAIAYILGLVLVFVGTALEGFPGQSVRHEVASFLLPGLPLLCISIICAVRGQAMLTRWRQVMQAERRYKQWRLALWFGEATDAPLADPQPVAQDTLTTLPFAIEYQVRWPVVLGANTVLSLILAIYLITSTLLENGLDIGHLWSVVMLIVAVALSFLFFPVVIWSAASLKGKIAATDEELTFALRDETMSIRWDDARLFALIEGRERGTQRYELSCSGEYPGKVIRWKRYSRSSRFNLVRPTLPYDQYERQMDRLLGVIAAHTGLPLYDLR